MRVDDVPLVLVHTVLNIVAAAAQKLLESCAIAKMTAAI